MSRITSKKLKKVDSADLRKLTPTQRKILAEQARTSKLEDASIETTMVKWDPEEHAKETGAALNVVLDLPAPRPDEFAGLTEGFVRTAMQFEGCFGAHIVIVEDTVHCCAHFSDLDSAAKYIKLIRSVVPINVAHTSIESTVRDLRSTRRKKMTKSQRKRYRVVKVGDNSAELFALFAKAES
jgi:hypothetical protein